ncbi:MACPF domain-containing protein [Acorus gramineus]|uniref:MACPF domain-containing protein n=1 Tax=Acorus gramineus TaxID=55184 RepID=A0AAV9B2N0_ACOGR|nr:MACPF domain-containing protein [Acorus gramineus]
MLEMVVDEELEPIVFRALRSLGIGFDLTSDFRLRFAKGYPEGRRLVHLDESNRRDVTIPGGPTIRGVPVDVACDKGDWLRFRSDVLEFNQMSELLNQKSSVQGKVPSGYFNALFGLSGSWLDDAKDTKCLAFDGYFVSLYNLHLATSPLVLRDEVKRAVPSNWDPNSLSRFIQTYGTHIIVGMAIGGQDVVCVRQKPSSSIPSSELKDHLENLGPYYRLLEKRKKKEISSDKKFFPSDKPSPEDLRYFLEFQVPRQWSPVFNELALGHQGKKTSYPTLQFTFLGPKLHVSTDQNLQMLSATVGFLCKDDRVGSLMPSWQVKQCLGSWVFFQIHLSHCTGVALLLKKSQVAEMVSSGGNPVTGLRLYLEGKKCNRLAIHVQHLSSLPSMNEWSQSKSSQTLPCQWRGSEDSASNYLEPIKCRRYSHVCTSAVKHNPEWCQKTPNGVFVVTGAQLVTKKEWTKSALHLCLQFMHLPNCSIQKMEWTQAPAAAHKSSFLVNLSTTFTNRETAQNQKHERPPLLNSGVYPEGPPVPVHSRKLLKYVDMTEIVRGPHDMPGHWLVIAAKLVTEGGKIGMHVKYALLNYSS